MIECIRFHSVLPFDENVKEEFISEIWGGAIDRWRGNITPDIEARIEMEIATFEQVDGYMDYLYFVWRVVIESNFFVMPYSTLAHASAQWQKGCSSRTELLAYLLGTYGKGDRERTLQ